MGIAPSGLTDVLLELQAKYPGLPMVISENGCALQDHPDADGFCDDRDRIAYLQAHVEAMGIAIERGVKVEGYFLWSLLDNFEWAWGYTRSFGLVRIEPGTLRRIPKASASWYGSVARANGLAARSAIG